MSSSITGFAWIDTNDDNIFNGSDTPFTNIIIELYSLDNLNVPISFTLTDNDGKYFFENLNTTITYLIKASVPLSYELITSNVGTDYLLQSHINPFTTFSKQINCCENDIININIGFRLLENFKISGIAFFDCNNDSMLTSVDSYLNGVSVYLLDENLNEISSTLTGLNSSSGYYEFINQESGNYTIKVTPPANLSLVLQNTNEFGSKINPLTSEYSFTLTNNNINNIYIGFTGNAIAYSKYCTSSTSSPCCSCNQNKC